MKLTLLSLIIVCAGCSNGMQSAQYTTGVNLGSFSGLSGIANFSGQTLTPASPLPAQCSSSEIVHITRPIATDAPEMGSFSYAFRYKAPTVPGAPVLVYLPGGPGMTSTDQVPEFLPLGWGYLLTDPRGEGCNSLAAVPNATVSPLFFRTTQIGADVVAAISNRGLKNYILYGLSYGTQLGTVVANAIETQGMAPPTAVVLEGVLGRAFTHAEIGVDYIAQWNLLRSSMPPDVLTALDTQASPYGISQTGWSRALLSVLLGGSEITQPLFESLSSDSILSLGESYTLSQIQSYANTPELADPMSVELYRQTMCREIDDTAPIGDLDPVFVSGQLVKNVAQEGTKCNGLHVTTPYDSATLQFSAKVYYFMGDSDPATPPFQGNYHYANHTGHAVRVVSAGAGHLSLQLNQELCASAVLVSIAGGGSDLQSVLGFCPSSVTVTAK